MALAAFTPLGAGLLIDSPLEELAGSTLDLADLLGRRGRDLAALPERLAAAASHEERLRQVEDLLLARVRGLRPDPLVGAALASIERSAGRVRIEGLARRIGLSQSALERRFRRLVGATPRRFASLVRLQTVLRLRAAGTDLTTLAHAAGYSDQPHFIKDFKRFAGLAPGAYFAGLDAG